MARFDVYHAPRIQGFLLDCQADLLDELDTRVVVPLLPTTAMIAATRLNPLFEIDGQSHIMQTPMIFSIPTERLGPPVLSLSNCDLDIIAALDMLFSGF
ncbi:MAG: CcdB family protein [Sphingopyxis sp.]